jgi:hypothetical protein
VKQKLLDAFLSSLVAWDKKHRIIGKTPPERLYQESVEALGTLPPGCPLLVDIGAGSGILGWPWLFEGFGSSVIFVESDPKKAAFLEFFRAELSRLAPEMGLRVRVVPLPYQSVSRETVEGMGLPYVLAARAFSGSLSLSQAHQASQFKDRPVFAFEAEGDFSAQKFVLKQVP